jgi:eukaryotic-like serine/threonine-protein kinase
VTDLHQFDTKYTVRGQCSDAGGMGTLLFVSVAGQDAPPWSVLKLCKLADPEMLARFKREVHVMQQFAGNGYVMPVVDANLAHDPPYFVMPFFEHGDLMANSTHIRADSALMEHVFDRMIDCVAQLHDRHILHRDIKPQNFLVAAGGVIVLSDLGLCCDGESLTAFTRSSQWAGTPSYLPPEFLLPGGFRDADVTADIFMLGKSFYSIASGRDPMYLVSDGILPQLFPVFERCCAIDKRSRYASLASLKQSLKAAFDVILGRAVGPATVNSLMRSIADRLKTSHQFIAEEVVQFLEQLALVDQQDQYQVCLALPFEAFGVLSQPMLQQHLTRFLAIYKRMAEDATYAWAFAEDIAKNMQVLVNATTVNAADKSEALRIAIISSVRQNRFAAMDTCRAMITSISDDELAQRVHDVLIAHSDQFIAAIDPGECRAVAIRSAIASIKAASAPPPNL